MVLLADLFTVLSARAELFSYLEFHKLLAFLKVTKRFAPLIKLKSPRLNQAESFRALLPSIQAMTAHVADLTLGQVDTLWEALGAYILECDEQEVALSQSAIDEKMSAFVIGSHLAVGVETLLPPVSICVNPSCSQRGRSLGGQQYDHGVFLYTLRRGTLPARVVSLYCKGA
ncbi:hypothetical protein C8Q76DRAFT_715700 [Earliella scabrosa]|nr:hypothetical protein C8Q76DRAFT_715700 [Earliella scabrosa]